MIYPVTMYAGKCDNCGHEIQLAGGEASAYGEAESVIFEMEESDWHIGDGTYGIRVGIHYCPDCWYWDDDDQLRVKSKVK